MNTLKQVLMLVTHDNYTVVLQTKLGQVLGESHEIAQEDLAGYLDYRVVGITQDWQIVIQDQV